MPCQRMIYGYIKVQKKRIKEDCVNHVHKRVARPLHTLLDKRKAQREPLGGKGMLTQDKIKKNNSY